MTQPNADTDMLRERIDDTFEFLSKDHPEIFHEQKHLDAGTIERAYWHYGYMAALRDIERQMKEKKNG